MWEEGGVRGIIVWAIYTLKTSEPGESVLGAIGVVKGSVNNGRGGSMLRARGLVERIGFNRMGDVHR